MTARHAVTIDRIAATLGLGFLIALAPAALRAQDDLRYRDGRFLETQGGVTIQRADEAASDIAVRNMPFLPGDRVWTDDAGRAEIVFADGEILWIAERSKLDSLGRGGPEDDERLGLRVFAGSFGARVRAGGPGFGFRAPGGNIITTGAAAFRVDVRSGETTVSVTEGEVLANFGAERMSVRAGERMRWAEGRLDGPFLFARSETDAFDRWCEDRDLQLTRMARAADASDERLPDELEPYAGDLEGHGDWVYDEPQGYVYVPRVAYDWAPYTYGRWVYTLYGWTWVPDEPWGFVTSHYGRWGYSSRIGWHWQPRLGFAGAWVGWSFPVGRWSNTVGWCALGFNDRPVGSYGYGSNRGFAVPRGSSVNGRGWTFAKRSDLGRGSAGRVRVSVPADEAARAVVWNVGSTPDREFRETARPRGSRAGSVASEIGGAAPRPGRAEGGVDRGRDRGSRIYVRPSPGDTTPELRSDPTTTIPSPESRRGPTIGQDGFKDAQDNNRRSRSRRDREEEPPLTETSMRPAADDAPAAAAPAASRRPAPSEKPTRDPLLSRFFRSITRPGPGEVDAVPRRTPNPENTPDDRSAVRPRSLYVPADRPSEDRSRANDRRERAQPAGPPVTRAPETRAPEARSNGARSNDAGQQRSRPERTERAEPRRSAPPPRSRPTPEGNPDR